ncbi:MAG: hypothetical protein HOP28_10720 [Gemmatimonadales bacterium]|nr:hypothetical protein [Gemmatimonadales bacterium]
MLRQFRRPLWLTLALAAPLAAPLAAQDARRGPVVSPTIGYHFLEVRRPATGGELVRSTDDFMLGVSLGIPIGRFLMPDLTYRTTFGKTSSFQAASLGLNLLAGWSPRAHVRAAVAMIQASQPRICPTSGPCIAGVDDWRVGYELEGGVEFRIGGMTLGPTVWLTRGSQNGVIHRSVGVGLRFRQ